MGKNDKSLTTTNARSYAQSLVDSKLGGKADVPVAKTLSNEEMVKLFAEYEMEPPIVEIGEGQAVAGILIGGGSPVEMASQGKDPKTGLEIPGNVVGTWIIDTGNGIKVRIMSGYQLDHWCPAHIGESVVLVKGRKKDRGQKQVREWLTGTKGAPIETTEG